jgi:hypothetical protein
MNAWYAKVSRYRKEHPSLDCRRGYISWIKYVLENEKFERDFEGSVPAAAVWFTVDA